MNSAVLHHRSAGVPVLGTGRVIAFGLALAVVLLLVSLIEVGPFSTPRVAAAGEWFAGIAGFAVLAWAVDEPRRREAEQRRRETNRKNEEVAQQTLRRIAELELQPGRLIFDPANFERLRVDLEAARAAIDDPEIRRRLVATSSALMVVEVLPEDRLTAGRSLTLRVIDLCTSTLYAVWRGDVVLPSWSFEMDGVSYWPPLDEPGESFRWLLGSTSSQSDSST